MNLWFLSEPKRLAIEREAIERMQSKSTWLEGVEWILDSGIVLKAQIKAHEYIYEVKLSYPNLFPQTPPTVKPIDDDSRWSDHQYTDGALCLEWGPDNWHPSITGAQVLESAYRLIHAENPLGNKQEKEHIPSRHFLTEGQKLRRKNIRFYVKSKFLDVISTFHYNKVANMKFAMVFENKTLVMHVTALEKEDETLWTSSILPEELKPSKEDIGLILKTQLPLEKIQTLKTITDIEELYDKSSVKPLSDEKLILVIDKDNKPHALFSFKSDNELLEIPIVTENNVKNRNPAYLSELNKRKIGIVGLGSLGSKVATSLARMGAEKFYLVDDDIFLSENIVRHTLDWKSVGAHKVDAVENQLKRISSYIYVKTSKINVTGQEATTSLNAVLSQLGNCDLIIDATASPKVFNFLSAVSVSYKKPMVWGEIFAGGIGGLIARSRPDIDPDPQTMRHAFYETTKQFPDIDFNTFEPYGIEEETGKVMIASDADVNVIASHLTRLAVDTVLENDPSMFPFSMYLIGLTTSWIFEAPFDTRPIKTEHLQKYSKKQKVSEEELRPTIEFIQTLLEKTND
ncbi:MULTISPECIES: ThiF family adenylyltransferase [unclassified Oceanobacillus]|uniref:ThiF family adenylyltransferase n=1 Tax=unclassified Oceanobacillus TaxID=2630292 RepID=UPI00300E2880